MQHRQEVVFTQQDGFLHEPPAEKGALARLWQEAWGICLDHHCSSISGDSRWEDCRCRARH